MQEAARPEHSPKASAEGRGLKLLQLPTNASYMKRSGLQTTTSEAIVSHMRACVRRDGQGSLPISGRLVCTGESISATQAYGMWAMQAGSHVAVQPRHMARAGSSCALQVRTRVCTNALCIRKSLTKS